MSPTSRRNVPSGNVVVISVVVLLVTLVAAVVTIAIAIEDGARAATMIGLLLPAVGAAVPMLLALGKVQSIQTTVDDLANGGMDAKVRAAVSEVLAPHLVDPSIREQLAKDIARRDGTG